MPRSVTPFLMFPGQADAALALYTVAFPDAHVVEVERFGPGEPGAEGSVKRGHLRLAGQDLYLLDSPVRHDFSFTPAVSLFVECLDEAEFGFAFARLADGGQMLMPPGDYGFSQRFGWLNDRFGVSWQLNLA